MRITAVEEYGLRCLVAMARKGPEEQSSISEIADREGLSVPYVSKLLSIMRKAGLVTAERGRSGGFTIAKPLDQISLYEILTALGGPLIDPKHCQKHAGQREQCIHLDNCSVHDILGGLAGYVKEFLLDTTLQDLSSGLPSSFIQKARQKVVIDGPLLEKDVKKGDPANTSS